jgi:hypothetical protein
LLNSKAQDHIQSSSSAQKLKFSFKAQVQLKSFSSAQKAQVQLISSSSAQKAQVQL